MAVVALLACVGGIYACFLSWGVLQERVSTTPYQAAGQSEAGRFTHFVFLNWTQSVAACVVALCYLAATGTDKLRHRIPTGSLATQLIKVALLVSIASPFGYEALKHIDYPTMILGKSCKLLPVMLMSFILHRKTFAPHQYAAVALITVGVSCFMLWQPRKPDAAKIAQTADSFFGFFLLLINLLIDGATNSTQDYIFKAFKINGPEMMFFMNAFSAVMMLLYMLFVSPFVNYATRSSDFFDALTFLAKYPWAIFDVLLFALCGAIGQIFIFYTLERFGSLVLVTVNVTRKMLTMILSVFWFKHNITPSQWFAVSLVFSGIGLEAYMQRKKKLEQQKLTQKRRKSSFNANVDVDKKQKVTVEEEEEEEGDDFGVENIITHDEPRVTRSRRRTTASPSRSSSSNRSASPKRSQRSPQRRSPPRSHSPEKNPNEPTKTTATPTPKTPRTRVTSPRPTSSPYSLRKRPQ